MKRTKKNQNLRGWLLTLALVFGIFLCSSEAALAAGTAKVVASSGKIRAGADTSADTVASVKKGDKLDVIASKKDGSGYTWYKVYINDEDTGYIRADLVTVEGTISEEKENGLEEAKEKVIKANWDEVPAKYAGNSILCAEHMIEEIYEVSAEDVYPGR